MHFASRPTITEVPLSLLEVIYKLASDTKNVLYDKKLLKTYQSTLPVVCVGNVTTGGNGKSPVSQALVRLLQTQGRRPVLLLRGYGGTEAGPIEVTVPTDTKRFGDEACMHRLALSSTTVVVSRSRVAGAKFIESRKLGDIIILDDGFQHRALERDVNLLLFDADSLRQAGEGSLLPKGRLREPLTSALRRADGICLVERGEPLELKEFSPRLPVFHFPLVFGALKELHSEEKIPFAALRETPVAAIASIAKPEPFRTMLEAQGVKIATTLFKRDHATWSEQDLERLNSLPGDLIITTQKDEVKLLKLPGLTKKVLIVELIAEVSTEFSSWFLHKLCSR
jgi:tetraacyldisaccharide 4'-kinase